MSYAFEYYGQPLQHQKIVPGNTITGLSADCYEYKRWKLNYDAGHVEIVAGDWILCETSLAVAKVVSIYDDGTGTWGADTVAGYLIIDSKVGTFTNNKKLQVAAESEMAYVNEAVYGDAVTLQGDYPNKGKLAQSALVLIYANTALIAIDGGKPDQTQLIGIPMVANSSIYLKDINAIKAFKCVDYTASSASVVQVTYFF
jgi:hypothetical protein